MFGLFGFSSSSYFLLMKSINKLRFVNMVGGICFVIYAVAIHAIPVALINLFTVCINVYYLTSKNTSK